jgi:hypothetical protein
MGKDRVILRDHDLIGEGHMYNLIELYSHGCGSCRLAELRMYDLTEEGLVYFSSEWVMLSC